MLFGDSLACVRYKSPRKRWFPFHYMVECIVNLQLLYNLASRSFSLSSLAVNNLIWESGKLLGKTTVNKKSAFCNKRAVLLLNSVQAEHWSTRLPNTTNLVLFQPEMHPAERININVRIMLSQTKITTTRLRILNSWLVIMHEAILLLFCWKHFSHMSGNVNDFTHQRAIPWGLTSTSPQILFYTKSPTMPLWSSWVEWGGGGLSWLTHA